MSNNNEIVAVLRQALEVIQDYVDEYGPHDKDSGAQYVLNQLNQAIAEAEKQEPVAHCVVRPLQGNESIPQSRIEWKNGKPVAGPLYTSPPYVPTERQRQPLTDEEREELNVLREFKAEFLKQLEQAAHGIKGEA